MKRRAILLLAVMAAALLMASGTALAAITCPTGRTCFGTDGNDVILGTTSADIIKAKLGNDNVFGKAGSDQIFGQIGQDSLAGGPGRDTILGATQSDMLAGGTGGTPANPEQLSGGYDEDAYFFSGAWGIDVIPATGEPARGTDQGGNPTEASDGIIFSEIEHRAVKQPGVTNSLEIDLQLGYAEDVDGNKVSWEPGDIEDVVSGEGSDEIYTNGAATGVNTVDCGEAPDLQDHDVAQVGPEDFPQDTCEQVTVVEP
jgi:hypothetical protein